MATKKQKPVEVQSVEVSVRVPSGQLSAQDRLALECLNRANELVVDLTADDQVLAEQTKAAGEQAKNDKTAVNEREKMRKCWTDPIAEAKKNIDNAFKSGTEILQQAARIAGEKAVAGQRELNRRIAEKNRAIEEENERQRKLAEQQNRIAAKHLNKDGLPPMPVAPVIQSKTAEVKMVSSSKRWVHKVVRHSKDHDEIVLAYLRTSGKYEENLDKAIREKIRVAVNDNTIGVMKIKGVEIHQEEGFVAR